MHANFLPLIALRIIFRLIEFSQSIESYLSTHELFGYVLDAVSGLAALIAFNAVHPGRTLQGPNSDFSEERKADKQRKKEEKGIKKREKEAKKAEKKAEREKKKGGATTVKGVSYLDV